MRTIAVTVDDLPTASVLGDGFEAAERTTRDLVGSLRTNGIPAIGFVNEGKLAPSGALEERRVALLRQWLDAGLDLGNHTHSHVDLHRVAISDFTEDVLKGEQVTRRILREAGRDLKYFRHPFLHAGQSPQVRADLARFLSAHGYAAAPVTIDNSDYIFAAAHDRAAARGDADTLRKVASEYLAYMESVVAYYEEQSTKIVGREIAQTLLIHANALNAANIGALAGRLRARGYRFVTLDEALNDPAYASRDEYYGAGGISWLHRWALTQGKRGQIFAGEPAVPEWIRLLAQPSATRVLDAPFEPPRPMPPAGGPQ